MYKILVIDDQYGADAIARADFFDRSGLSPEECQFCSGQIDGRNSEAFVVESVRRLWSAEGGDRLKLILLDVQFTDPADSDGGRRFGLRLLNRLRAEFGAALPIVMLTSYEEHRELANSAGACGFLPKSPAFFNAEEVRLRVRRWGLYPDERGALIGEARAYLETLRELRRFAVGDLGECCLLGESGVGKTDLARFFAREARPDGPFEVWTAVHATDAQVLAGELFGHWEGAHSTAREHRAGRAERAHRGVLFIDEVADITPDLQTAFFEFRARQGSTRPIKRAGTAPRAARGTVTPSVRHALDLVGDYDPSRDRIEVDVAIVYATDLPIDDEAWREANGYRLALFNALGAHVRVPPLRERREDIVPLFEGIASRHVGRPVSVSREAAAALVTHAWREGNVRELRTVAEVAAANLGGDFDTVHLHHLDGPLSRPGTVRGVEGAGAGGARAETAQAGSIAEGPRRLLDAVVRCVNGQRVSPLTVILGEATGAEYPSTTEAQRALKAALKPWFAPTGAEKRRLEAVAGFIAEAERVRADPILAGLWAYAEGSAKWDEVTAVLLKDPRVKRA